MRKILLTIISLGLALWVAGCQLALTQPAATPLPVVQLPAADAATPTRTAVAPKITAASSPSKSGSAPALTAIPAPTPQPRIMALGVRTTMALRALPQADAALMATLPGSQVIWAEGRSADDRWVRVSYGDAGASAWVARGDIKLFDETAALPIIGSADFAIAPPAAPTVRARSAQAGLSGRVLVDQLNIRRGPGVDQGVIGLASADQTVEVIGRSQEGDWLAVAWQGETGWLAARFVTLTGDVAGLPALAVQTSNVPSQSAPAAVAGGKIVFQTAIGGDIYLVNADGSGLRRLTDGMDPILSPDGGQVAFARWGSPHGVFVLDLRTGQERRIASVNRPRGPTWSPDGARLVFTYVTRTRTCVDLGFVCVDPDQARQMFGGRDCVDTPQGRRCVSDYPVVTVDDNGLAAVNPRDGNRENWLSEGLIQSVQWRPTQNQIIFRGKQGLQSIAPGDAPTPLSNDSNIGSPVWSPDGQRMAAQMHIHDRNEIVLLDAAGNVVRYLTQPPPTYDRPGHPAPNNVAPTWSPDGRALLFLSDRDGAWRPYIMDADGARQRLFLPDTLGQLAFRYDFAAERVANWGR